MSRVIKFRAWDRFYKVIFIPLYFNFDYGLKVGHRPFLQDPPHFLKVPEEAELMQFTGLHDKNKKEICENDIIKSERTGNNYLVAWEKDKACFMLWFKNFDETPYNFLHNECNGLVQSEVLGNIHEHPELLK